MEKKLNFEVKDGNLEIGLDSNQDGEKSLKMKLYLSEALGEVMSRGDAVEGAKLVSLKFEFTKLKVQIDTDKDGEPLLELEIDLGEVFDEVQSLFKKDKSGE